MSLISNFSENILKKLFEQRLTGIFCDVSFVKEDVTIYGHSCILASFSPLLHKLFSYSFNDSSIQPFRQYVVNISYITRRNDNSDMNCLSCVCKVIDFFYTGLFEVNDLHKDHLINIANNLEIEVLLKFLNEGNSLKCKGKKLNKQKSCTPKSSNELEIAGKGQKSTKYSTRTNFKKVFNCGKYNNYFSKDYSKHESEHINHKCEECGFIAPYKSILKRHILKHTKPFLCSFEDCSVRTITEYNLKQHMLTHISDKNYICERCCVKFTYSKNLLRHQRTIHDSARVYKCMGCTYYSPRFDKLKEHCKSSHSGDINVMQSLDNLITCFKKNIKPKRKICKSLLSLQHKTIENSECIESEVKESVIGNVVNSVKEDKECSEVTQKEDNRKVTYILSETTGEFSIISENEGERVPVASVTSTNVLTIGNFREGTGSVTLNEATGVLTLNNINSESTGAVFLNESTGELSFINLTKDAFELEIRHEKSKDNEMMTQLNEVTGEMFTVRNDKNNSDNFDDFLFDNFDMDFINDESCDGFDDLDNLLFDPDPFELLFNQDESDSFSSIPHLNEATGELSFESTVESQGNELPEWSSAPSFNESLNIQEQIEDSYSLLLNEFTGELS